LSDARIRAADTDEAVPLGILAGGSGVPCELAELVSRRGRKVHIVALLGEAEPGIARFPHTWVNWGGIGTMLRAFRDNGCGEVVFVGRVRRPNIGAIRPDMGFWKSLPLLLGMLRGGDDAILRTIVGFFERHGLRVVGVHQAAPELVAPAGVLGRHDPSAQAREAIAICAGALAALGPFDAAQAAVARAGGLHSVEGADGTDAMLRRLSERPAGAARRPSFGGDSGPAVLVKLPKPDQERRIDLPAIGPETVRRVAEAGLAGIAVLGGETLFAERARALALADEAGIFVMGLGADDALIATAGATADRELAEPAIGIDRLKPLAGRPPVKGPRQDAELGSRVVSAVEAFWPQASVVVSRGYVLATEGAGGAMGAAERAGRLKPWGARLLRRRTGVLAMTDIAGELGHDPAEIVRRAAASGLAGIVVLRSPRDEAGLALVRAAAEDAGLFLLAPGDGL
jgi:DUF1009 family protein